jgi:hypothetical protein
MLRSTCWLAARRAAASSLRATAACCALIVGVAVVACGGYSGPPDIETARAGIRPEYRIAYAGEAGKTVLELLRENAESVVTEGSGDELLVTSINGIDGGVEGRYWLYYVNEQAGLIAASRMNTVQGDSIEWLFTR